MIELLLKNEAFKATEMIEVSEEVTDENGKLVLDEYDMPVRKWVARQRFPNYTPKTREELTSEVSNRIREVTDIGGEKMQYIFTRRVVPTLAI